MTKTVIQDNTKYILKGSNRWIQLQYNLNGSYYFKYQGKRQPLENFVRTNGVWMNNKTLFDNGIHAIDSTEYYQPLGITLSECGEAVKVWTVVSLNIGGSEYEY